MWKETLNGDESRNNRNERICRIRMKLARQTAQSSKIWTKNSRAITAETEWSCNTNHGKRIPRISDEMARFLFDDRLYHWNWWWRRRRWSSIVLFLFRRPVTPAQRPWILRSFTNYNWRGLERREILVLFTVAVFSLLEIEMTQQKRDI